MDYRGWTKGFTKANPGDMLLNYEGERRWVPEDKVEELEKELQKLREEFWDKYFNESK